MASQPPAGEVTRAGADVDGTRCVCDEGGRGVRLCNAWLSAGVFLCVAAGQGGGCHRRSGGRAGAQR